MTPYHQKLLDPRWQKCRLLKLEAAEWRCQSCGNDKETLHVHHAKYVRGRDPWEYGQDELQVLCGTCHKNHHEVESELAELFAPGGQWRAVLSGLISGFVLDRRVADGFPFPDTTLATVANMDAMMVGVISRALFDSSDDVKREVVKLVGLMRTKDGSNA